jgi:hypothetical protein
MTVLFILLIASATASVIVHHLVDSDDVRMGVRVFDDMVPTQDVELERVIEV